MAKPLNEAIAETKDHLNLNHQHADDSDFDDEDAMDSLLDECGKGRDGSCSLAGTEYCDWECPFS